MLVQSNSTEAVSGSSNVFPTSNLAVPATGRMGSPFNDGTSYLSLTVVPENGAPDAFLGPDSPIDPSLTTVTGEALSHYPHPWLLNKPYLRRELELIRREMNVS